MLVMRFKEDQGRIEDGIIAALDRLSQFEEAFENSLKEKVTVRKPVIKEQENRVEPIQPADTSSNPQVFFEIPQDNARPAGGQNSRQTMETGKDIQLNSKPDPERLAGGQNSVDGELDIF